MDDRKNTPKKRENEGEIYHDFHFEYYFSIIIILYAKIYVLS